MNRRDFIKLSTALSLMPSFSYAKEFDDYKAIVVLYLNGGNDSLNMFIPANDDEKTGYPNYSKIRTNLAVSDTELSLETENGELKLGAGDENPYFADNNMSKSYQKGFYKHNDFNIATNGIMPEIAHMINNENIAVLLNTGNLIAPATKEELLNQSKPTPPFLFAHNYQRALLFNGESAIINYTGWAGRVADKLGNINNSDIYTQNISFNGSTHLFDSDSESLILPTGGVIKYRNIRYREMYDNFVNVDSDEIGVYYKKLKQHSFMMQDALADDFANAYEFGNTNAYGLTLFSKPDANTLGERYLKTDLSLLSQLKSVAQWAKIFKDKNFQRNIFYISQGGYDTHSDQKATHSSKLRGLSYSLGDFYLALKEIEMENDVVVMVVSEFSRSTGDNGDGTDHAWGGHYFVLGGDVKGGEYGTMPDLTLGSDDDISKKGRLIPTISNSQYIATVLKWFGLDDNEIKTILPEIDNFDTKYLDFL
jgi:uncharacterized protein (DUF1501 family)